MIQLFSSFIVQSNLAVGYVLLPAHKRLNGDGFLITTYPTDAIKEGERIWSK